MVNGVPDISGTEERGEVIVQSLESEKLSIENRKNAEQHML